MFVATFKKRPFHSEFEIFCEDGKVTSALCKYCSEVEYEFMHEAKGRKIKGSALLSVENIHQSVTYIMSFHNW